MYPQAAHKRRKKSDCLLFQIDGGGGQIGLNARMFATPRRTARASPCQDFA
jgi:hypothetical protein